MEFQEAVTRVMFNEPIQNGISGRDRKDKRRQKWKLVIHSSSSSAPSIASETKEEPPREFLCPISDSLMNDPVIVSSGHTFERACVLACNTLGFTPTLKDGTVPNFSAVIPNLALKTAILNWCKRHHLNPPKPLDFFAAENLVRTKIATEKQQQNDQNFHKKNEGQEGVFLNKDSILTQEQSQNCSSCSNDSLELIYVSTPPLQLKTRPSCYSSASSSSEIEILNVNEEEEEFVTKLKSPLVFEIEEALVSLRKITRTKEEARLQLCTPKILSALQSLIISRYTNVQVNSTACLVNLSLEKMNKVKIVRSGIVPSLINVLKGGYADAQEHACGAMFSLALDDVNKTAIGVLGALPPLLHLLRAESERTRHDAALALYHLSLVQSNRNKLVRLGCVQILLGMVRLGEMVSRVLLVLCNLACCMEGRAAMLDSGGVECLVGLLRGNELDSDSARDSCVSVLYGLSQGGLRFRGLAKAAGAVELFLQLEESGSDRSKEKAKRMLEMIKARVDEEEEEVDWEELLDSRSSISRTRGRLSRLKGGSSTNSSEF